MKRWLVSLYLECRMQAFKKKFNIAFISLSKLITNILRFFYKFEIDKLQAVMFNSACNLKRVNFPSLQYDLKRCSAEQPNFRDDVVIVWCRYKSCNSTILDTSGPVQGAMGTSQYQYIRCYKYLNNIRPRVQLHAFYIAKMVFTSIEVYCARKKMSTSLKNLGNFLFCPFQGINIKIE